MAVALLELVIGVLVLLGFLTRAAAAAGLALNLLLFLTATWHTSPYFLGSDIVFVFAWLPLVLGAEGQPTIRDLLAYRSLGLRRARARARDRGAAGPARRLSRRALLAHVLGVPACSPPRRPPLDARAREAPGDRAGGARASAGGPRARWTSARRRRSPPARRCPTRTHGAVGDRGQGGRWRAVRARRDLHPRGLRARLRPGGPELPLPQLDVRPPHRGAAARAGAAGRCRRPRSRSETATSSRGAPPVTLDGLMHICCRRVQGNLDERHEPLPGWPSRPASSGVGCRGGEAGGGAAGLAALVAGIVLAPGDRRGQGRARARRGRGAGPHPAPGPRADAARAAAALRAGTPAGTDLAARGRLLASAEGLIQTDASKRSAAGEFNGPIMRVQCEAYPPGAETIPAAPMRQSAPAATPASRSPARSPPRRATEAEPSGIRTGSTSTSCRRYAFCKVRGRPGELASGRRGVPAPGRCGLSALLRCAGSRVDALRDRAASLVVPAGVNVAEAAHPPCGGHVLRQLRE